MVFWIGAGVSDKNGGTANELHVLQAPVFSCFFKLAQGFPFEAFAMLTGGVCMILRGGEWEFVEYNTHDSTF